MAPISAQIDAINYELLARKWASGSWQSLFSAFDPSKSYVISWVGGLLYKLAAPSPIMLNVVNAFVGTLLIILTYVLARGLIGIDRAKIVTWIAAVFPFAILYASAFRREVFSAVFFTLGLLFVVKWRREISIWPLLWSALAFAAAALFHGSYVVAIAALGMIAGWDLCNQLVRAFLVGTVSRRILLVSGLGVLAFLALFSYALISGVSLSEFGSLQTRLFLLGDTLSERINRGATGTSAYPDFLSSGNLLTEPWVIPGRIIYFLFSPFPWDIHEPSHILGLFASATFIYIAVSIWKGRKFIAARGEMVAILFIILIMIFVFGIAIDNIGAAIRHRTKFIFALLALCYHPVFSLRVRNRRETNMKPSGIT
jgi:hypothetical protein